MLVPKANKLLIDTFTFTITMLATKDANFYENGAIKKSKSITFNTYMMICGVMHCVGQVM